MSSQFIPPPSTSTRAMSFDRHVAGKLAGHLLYRRQTGYSRAASRKCFEMNSARKELAAAAGMDSDVTVKAAVPGFTVTVCAAPSIARWWRWASVLRLARW